MITLFVVGYIVYMFVGILGIGGLCYKYLDDNKVCIACVHYGLGMAWTFLPITLFFDFK
jgi:hypothetical protein